MSYDYGRKMIANMTRVTGVEAKNIAKQLEKQGFDYQSFDWKTIGENLYGYGHRVKGVKHHLKEMYGVTLGKKVHRYEEEKFSDIEVASLMPTLMEINDRRSKKARMMDYSIGAKHTYKPTNKKGVKRWKRHPNRFDIIGIDDKI